MCATTPRTSSSVAGGVADAASSDFDGAGVVVVVCACCGVGAVAPSPTGCAGRAHAAKRARSNVRKRRAGSVFNFRLWPIEFFDILTTLLNKDTPTTRAREGDENSLED